MASHKIEVKIGRASFSAEGDKETVDAQYQQFLKSIGRGSDVSELSAELLNRVFSTDHPQIVSLKILPDDETEAMLLLLYGYRALNKKHDVSPAVLAIGMKRSGMELSQRTDRLLARLERFVTQSGEKKGRRYGLSNAGVYFVRNIIVRIGEYV